MQDDAAPGDDLEDVTARLTFLEELLAKIAEGNRALGLRWEDFPRLTTDLIAGNRRFKAVMAGRGKGAVNLSVCLKRFMKEHFPEYVFRDKQMDYHWFAKCLTPQSNILLLFERIHQGGLGKTYSVKIGLEVGAQSHMYSLFRCFDHLALEWTYGLQDELNECLMETRALLRLALPEFEKNCRQFLEHGGSELVVDRPHRGSLSFLDAVRVARRALGSLGHQYSAVDGAWLMAHARPDRFVGTVGHRLSAGATPSGRLGPEQSWSVRFADIQGQRTATVVVPYYGRLQFILGEQLSVNRSNVHHMLVDRP